MALTIIGNGPWYIIDAWHSDGPIRLADGCTVGLKLAGRINISMRTQTMEVVAPPAPAPIYPARGKLAKKLSLYQRASADLEDYKGRAIRAELDEELRLNQTQQEFLNFFTHDRTIR